MFINQHVEIIIINPNIPPNIIPSPLNEFLFDLDFSRKS